MSFPQAANTYGLAHVYMAGDGSGADVEPVDILGREFLCVYVSLDTGLRTHIGHYAREVFTVSTQPVDNAVSNLSPSYGIQAFSSPAGPHEPGLRARVSKAMDDVDAGNLHWELALALQEGSVGIDELLRVDVLD